jgi:tetratricopeptide (TPR) repeat protein
MANLGEDDKPAPSPLEAERERLRKAGYADTEISQILVARALGSSGNSADAPTGQGVMSGTLSSVVAIGSYARGTVFTLRNDLATIFDRTALASARVGAAVMLVFKVAVIAVLAYAGWQEWRQHIISETEIAASQARKIRAEECTARVESAAKNMRVSDLEKGIYSNDELARDCDPNYAAREAQCDARSKAIVSDLDKLKPGDNEGVSRLMKQVNEFKGDCRITEERQQFLKAAAGRAVALFQGSTHQITTDDPAACDEKFKIVLTAIETIDLKDKDPATTLKTRIEQHRGECTVTEAQQAAAKSAFDTRAAKLAKLSAVVARIQEIKQIGAAHQAGNYTEALKLSEAHVATTEAEEIKNEGNAGKDTGSALANLSWEALFARDFNKAYDAATRSIKLDPSDPVPITNQAHALMLLGRTEEARAIYLAHKGESLQGKTWERVISEDFAKLRKAGITHPMMAETEDTLGTASQASAAATPGLPPPLSVRPPPGLGKAASPEKTMAAVVTDQLTLRTRPDKSADAIVLLNKGAQVEVVSTDPNGWQQVQLSDQSTSFKGYVNGNYLTHDLNASPRPLILTEPADLNGSPSYCGQQNAPIEYVICSNADLAQQESAMAKSYNLLLARVSDPDTLRNSQQQWNRDRRLNCHIPSNGRLRGSILANAVQCVGEMTDARARDLRAGRY